MYKLKLKHHFDSSHHLLKYKGACSRVHGHRWLVEIEIETENLNSQDMVVDFKILKEIINKLDHENLNEILDFNPTAENISKFIYDEIFKVTEYKSKVTLWESPEASITYEE